MPAPRYKVLVDSLAADIRSGRLTAGSRLPTHRQLAAREQIAVVTATRVYAELEAAGLVSREQGRGTFVRDLALPAGHGIIDQQVIAGDVIDLNFNYPSLPNQAAQLRHALREIAGAGDLDALLRYQPHCGRPHDKASIARHLTRRGVHVNPDRVLIVNGAQHGLAAALMATLHPGDVVAVDALTYPGFKVLAHGHHMEQPRAHRHDCLPLARRRYRRPARSRQARRRQGTPGYRPRCPHRTTQVSHPASYFVWLPLPQGARADRVAATLARHHISVSTAEPFATTTHTPQAIRLALGSADRDGLPATLRTVAHVVSLDAAR